jgi:hypothetical protein
MRYGFPNKGIVKRRIDQIPTIKRKFTHLHLQVVKK